MAGIDVTELLSDPDFSDTITVVRTVETVGSNGRSSLASQEFPNVVAVVTAGQGDILKRFPELTRVEGAVMIRTTFQLVAATTTTQPDQIIWKGQNYTITMLNDWSNFGSGFVSAVATLTDYLEDAP